MDPILTLGKKLTADPVTGEPHRDAIHIAILPAVVGDDRCYPGHPVKLAYGTTDQVLCAEYNEKEAIGIIDPFLMRLRYTDMSWDERNVKRGDLVWVFLFPGTVQGMRHHWYHPAIDEVRLTDNEHELWIRQFCDRWNFDYDELIRESTAPLSGDNKEEWDREHWVTARGIDLHSAKELGEDHSLFWQHLEALVGREFGEEHRQAFGWSCSC